MGSDDPTNLTVEILKQIRDELKSHGTKLDQVRTELGARLDVTNERLDRVVHEQIRHATAIVGFEGRMGHLEGRMGDLAGHMGELAQQVGKLSEGQRAIVSELVKLNDRVDNVLTGPVGRGVRDTTGRVDRLEERVDALERRSG